MAGTVHMAMSLLLLFFITTGVKGQNGLTLAERSYDIKFPCEEDLVCFHLWQINTWRTSRYFAIVSNGEIQTAESEEKKCALQIKDLTAEHVGRHQCQQMPNNFSSHNTAPVLNLLPAKTVSLQCVALTYVDRGRCSRRISLTWVDEAGVEIQEDSYHQINQPSLCDITLTVTFQEPGIRKFRCQATVDQQVQTSAELWVRAPALRGKGRGFIPDLELEPQGGNQDVTGAAVGVVGCVVLTAVIAVFVVNTRRRRRNSQLLDDPHSVQSGSNNVMNTDDVIYADVILPAGSDRVLVLECESTEYACVRYM